MTHIVENSLVAGGLIALFSIPFYIVIKRSKQKQLDVLKNKLFDKASALSIDLTRYEPLSDKIIGWAKPNKLLLLADVTEPEATVYNLAKANKTYVRKTMNGTAVGSIALQIADAQNKVLDSIPLYRQFQDNEMKLKEIEKQAKDWEMLLNSYLSA
jgi:hypothetical protein